MDKEDLKKYVPLKKEAEELRLQAEHLEDDIISLRSVVNDGMPKGSAVSDKIGSMVARVEELREEYLNKYDLALCELYKIERLIESLDDITERRLIRKRYIQGMRWEDICIDLNYSWQHIHRIHSKILIKIKDVIE